MLSLADIIDSRKGKTAIVFAHGPSAKEHVVDLVAKSKDKDKYCFISMGEIDIMETNLKVKFHMDFWVMANTQMTIEKNATRFNSHPESTLVWADTADRTPYSFAMKTLKIPHLPYDQRHFNNQKCENCKVPLIGKDGKGFWVPMSCRVIPDRNTIQETLQNYTSYNDHYGTGSTVALHATNLGILLGCKEVHIYGVDLSYKNGYVDGATRNAATFDNEIEAIIKDFDIINKSAHNVGVRLVNFSKESPLANIMTTI